MNLNEVLKKHGKTMDDITKIYHGKNRWCRCGCGGRYFYKSEKDKGYTRSINHLIKDDFPLGDYEPIEYGKNYINIPQGDYEDNKCYCIYFD